MSRHGSMFVLALLACSAAREPTDTGDDGIGDGVSTTPTGDGDAPTSGDDDGGTSTPDATSAGATSTGRVDSGVDTTGDDGGGATWPEGRSGVSYVNSAGDTVLGTVFVPAGDGPWPAVLVLHGSGGLFDEPADPDNPDLDPATAPLENQFEEWAEMITDQGWIAFMPGSFFSRGFFDWNNDPHPQYDQLDRLVFRTLDAWAALELLCEHPDVLCDRMGMVGFSDGGTTILMSLHDGVEGIDGMQSLAGHSLPPPVSVTAYYPGCGLQGVVSLSDPTGYFPVVPLHVRHAELDPLLDNCEVRFAQTQTQTMNDGLPSNPFTLDIAVGVDHGFDSSPANATEEAAKAEARAGTLAALHAALDP